jgi:hypothetical protein
VIALGLSIAGRYDFAMLAIYQTQRFGHFEGAGHKLHPAANPVDLPSLESLDQRFTVEQYMIGPGWATPFIRAHPANRAVWFVTDAFYHPIKLLLGQFLRLQI